MLKLKELRKGKNIAQKQFAKDMGVAQNTVSNWENENRMIDAEMLQKIANYFDVTIDYLLGYEKNEKKTTSTTETSEIEADAVKLYQALVSSGLLKEGQDLTRKQIDGLCNIAGLISTMFDD